ncbi:MAG: hypothetical protein JO223_10360 [Hyphomicrobiales bacterium]|nr:hypothetical protein [Hyphomicrobiales bacterium]
MAQAAKGPRQMIEEDGRVPLLDIGTVAQVRAGRIKVRGDIASFQPKTVAFVGAPPQPFDAVILPTGFRPDLRALLPDARASSASPANRSSAGQLQFRFRAALPSET